MKKPPDSRADEGTNSTVFVVDRREGKILVVINDSGDSVDVEASRIPPSCRVEGAVLRVPSGLDSAPAWENAVRDVTEEKRRLALLTEQLEKLRRKDPGGDISL